MLNVERSAIKEHSIHKALFRIHATFSGGFTCLTPPDYIMFVNLMFVNPARLQCENRSSGA